MHRVTLTLLGSALGLAGLTACSQGEDTDPEGRGRPDTDPAVELIAADLVAHPKADLTAEGEARCVAEVVVDELGAGRLEALGLDTATDALPELTVPPMTEPEGDSVYAAYDRCLDFTRGDIDGFRAEGLSESEARCASDRYRSSPIPRSHLLLRAHHRVPHPELHAQVEALWEGAKAACRR